MLRSLTKYLLLGVKEKVKPLFAWVPYEWRRGATYKHWRKFLEEAQFHTRDQIELWQLEQLKHIVRYAYDNTKGYRELYDQAGVRPDDIQKIDDIRHFPFITKQTLQDNLENFSVPTAVRFYTTTGGSTGIPFGFYLLYENSEIEDAFIHWMWSSVGWKPDECNAVLRGAYIGHENSQWTYDVYRKELLLSSYYLSPKNLDSYIKAVNLYRPMVLQAYPSALGILCDLLKETGRVGEIKFDLIILASENIYDWMLEKYREAFPDSLFFSFYGHAERAVLAPWCEHSRNYHLVPFYGLTEIVGGNNEEVKEGEEGELIGTGFHMRGTPFIRYRTGDRAVKGPDHCDSCGRNFQLIQNMVGRSHEILVTGSGRHISMTAINMHSDVFDNVRQFQFYQDTAGVVEFRVIPKASYSDADTAKIYAELMKKLGDDVQLKISTANDIQKSKSGKFRFLDQRLPVIYHER
jgi:phenylacetate-CoA ligase